MRELREWNCRRLALCASLDYDLGDVRKGQEEGNCRSRKLEQRRLGANGGRAHARQRGYSIVALQCQMRATPMIVGNEALKVSVQAALVEYDLHLVNELLPEDPLAIPQ